VSEHTLGKYVVEEELGRGGMGIVYRGTDTESGEAVAVKVLPAQLALDPDFRNRFRREIFTLEQLDHKGIVKIFAHGEQDGALYYAMEFVQGQTLDKFLLSRAFSPLEATEIILQCARVLEYAHAAGVIHRDIKPANIMITDEGEVKLTDFGIAKLADATRMTATTNVLGTVEYMSPEQSAGRFVDPRSDIYSLGVVYYQMATAHLPVTGTSATDIVVKLRTKPVEPPVNWVPGIPDRMNDLIMQMLAKDPAERVPSAKALVRELEIVSHRLAAPPEEAILERRELAAATRTHGPWYASPWLWGAAAMLITLVLWGVFGMRPARPEELLQQVRNLAAAGSVQEKVQALRLATILKEEHPQSSEAGEVETLITALEKEIKDGTDAQLMFINANVLFRRAKTADDSRRLEAARQMFTVLVDTYPDTPRAADARGVIREIDKMLQKEDNDPASGSPDENTNEGENG